MKRKCLAVGIILLFIGTAIISTSGQKIDRLSLPISRGHTLYVGGSGPGNYTKIQDAIDNSSNGDTVFVYNGTYNENDSIRKSVNLIGEKRENTIIIGSIDVLANYVNISGFTVRNVLWDSSGISIQKYSYCNISNNIIDSKGFNGIYTDLFSAYDIISNNVIMHGQDEGIFADGGNLIIRNNVIIGNSDGIRILGDSDCVRYNIIKDNRIGIVDYDYIQNNTISFNQIESNSIGISFNIAGRKNNVSFNNFINNTKQAEFTEYLFKKIIWNKNYWNDYHGTGQKKIKGTLILFGNPFGFDLEIPWVNFDWHPATQPYNISGVI
jgi:hypothetical protein